MSDSVRKMVALALWCVTGAFALFACCGSVHRTGEEFAMSAITHDHGDAGLVALRAGNYVKAEHEFTKAGDDLRLAEVFVRQERYDEAADKLKGKRDGQSEFLRGMVAYDLGDSAEAEKRFKKSAKLGNANARDALIAYYPGA